MPHVHIFRGRRMLSATKSEIDLREVKAPRNIVVDCDAGIDDALALIILLAGHTDRRINIKAITCVNGNTKVDNVVKNVFRTLNVCDCMDVSYYISYIRDHTSLACLKRRY